MDNRTLVADLVDWIAKEPKPYTEVMDAWRTSCPRLSIWEDAVDMGYVERKASSGSVPMVSVTPEGKRFLKQFRGD